MSFIDLFLLYLEFTVLSYCINIKHIFFSLTMLYWFCSGLILLKMLSEYVDISKCLPSLSLEVVQRVVEILKLFNTRTCQLVLGAGAMQVYQHAISVINNASLFHWQLYANVYCDFHLMWVMFVCIFKQPEGACTEPHASLHGRTICKISCYYMDTILINFYLFVRTVHTSVHVPKALINLKSLFDLEAQFSSLQKF